MFFLTSSVPALPLTSLSSISSQTSSYLILPSSPIPNFKPIKESTNFPSNSNQTNNLFNHTYNVQNLSDKLNSSEFSSNLTDFNLNMTDNKTLENTIAIVVPILFSLIFIIGLFGNALVVIVVVFNASMRSTTNLLILNLAIADLLFIVFCVPFTASDYYFSQWQFGHIWCKIVQYLILVLACSSNYTLVLMSLDRYLAVVHPISSMSIRTARNAYIAICLVWVFIIMACIPALQVHTIVKYGDGGNNATFLSCTFNSTNNITHQQFQLGFMVTSYVIPLLIAFALYFLMLKKLWFGTSSSVNYRINNKRCRKRVTRMVIIVVAVFAICWAPIQIILVLKSLNLYQTDQPVNIVIQIASQVLAYMNSCVNPILYSFLSENFRKAFHKVIACNLVGIYGVNQSSIMQTGQTSCAQSGAFNFTRINSQLKRSTQAKQTLNDLNNNAKDLIPDQEELNRNLKSVNFSIIADGGLFPHRTDSYKALNKTIDEENKLKSGCDVTNSLNKPIKPILSKGRFKKAKCLDDDEKYEENDEEFNKTIELHPMNSEPINCIPMYELTNKQSVPSVDESTLNNDTMNKQPVNSSTTMNTMTTLSNAESNGVFL